MFVSPSVPPPCDIKNRLKVTFNLLGHLPYVHSMLRPYLVFRHLSSRFPVMFPLRFQFLRVRLYHDHGTSTPPHLVCRLPPAPFPTTRREPPLLICQSVRVSPHCTANSEMTDDPKKVRLSESFSHLLNSG